MTSRWLPAVYTLCLLACGPAWAINPSDSGFLPPAHELFEPLAADPRELQYALRVVLPEGRHSLGEAAIGDYLGVYRWTMPWKDAYFQISVGGGVFGRFDLAEESNSLLVSDYYGNLPFDLRSGKWSFRFMPYHTSSHLGDDYLSATGATSSKHTWDNLRWLASYDIQTLGRLYGGYTYAFRELPNLGRNALQGGFELYSAWWGKGHAQVYWANDFQSWERSAWNPMFTTQLGVKIKRRPDTPRYIAVFTEYGVGQLPQGQYVGRKENHWNLGIKFDLE